MRRRSHRRHRDRSVDGFRRWWRGATPFARSAYAKRNMHRALRAALEDEYGEFSRPAWHFKTLAGVAAAVPQ